MAYVLFLIVAMPLLGRRAFARLEEALKTDPDARLKFFRRNALRRAVFVVPVLVIGLMSGKGLAAIYIAVPQMATFGGGLFVCCIIGGAIGAVRLRRATPSLIAGVARRNPRIFTMLPANRAERAAWAWVSLSAGVVEELVFRGFGIAFVRWAWPGATTIEICAVTALVFGAIHLYQGPRGVLTTGAIGYLFAAITISTGSLIPAMVLHTAIDLRLDLFREGALAEAKLVAAEPAKASDPWSPPPTWALPPPGWYPDPWRPAAPSGECAWRWWDGAQWTAHAS